MDHLFNLPLRYHLTANIAAIPNHHLILEAIHKQGGVAMCLCCGAVCYDEYCAYCEFGEHEECVTDEKRGEYIRMYTREESCAANDECDVCGSRMNNHFEGRPCPVAQGE